tara:strand:+ start:468 stop:641 length:174 start_codon:yes stop_codon:yes gene_type:complete
MEIYEIRLALQNFLKDNLKVNLTDAGVMLDGSAADFAFELEGKKYEVNIDDVTKEIA